MCTWQEDFLDAHRRHWRDAELLYRNGRLANADHLYGLSAECGLKAMWVGTGHPLRPEHRVHINHFWNHFQRLRANSPNLRGFSFPRENPFNDWDVNQRYAAEACFDDRPVSRHRQGAMLIRNLVRGLVP